ncbi:MAG: acyltransferase [Lachnospiraceae bacterium]|nr:acyltransferase [Lachnospiraceae bacterium]
MRETFFSKKDSKWLHGVAALLLIYHHLFNQYCHFEHIALNRSWELNVAVFGRICVGIFAFISGYGLSVKTSERKSIKSILNVGFRQYLSFMKMYWFAFLLYVPLGVAFFGIKITSVGVLLRSFFYQPNQIYGEWWYVEQYIIILVGVSLFLCIYNHLEKYRYKRIIIIAALTLIIGLIICPYTRFIMAKVNRYVSIYLWISIMAVIIEKNRIYEKIYSCFSNKIIQILLSIFLVVISYVCRIYYVYNKGYEWVDIIIVPIFVYAVIVLKKVLDLRILNSVGEYFGKYGTYLWLAHPVYLYYWCTGMVIWPKYSLAIFMWLTIISLGSAIVLSNMKRVIEDVFTKCTKRLR